jgi:cytochrome c-type biogenesis protein CcmF
MIPELGHYALVLALALGLIQAITPIVGARGNDAALMGLASSTEPRKCCFVGLAFLALIVCYVTSDFSVATVYENAHSTMPLIYKVTSAWETRRLDALVGSDTVLFQGIGWRIRKQLLQHSQSVALAVQSWIACAFYCSSSSLPTLCVWRRPFRGRDLNLFCRTSASPFILHCSTSAMLAFRSRFRLRLLR